MQEGDEEIISREAIPGDPEQEECQIFVEYYIPEGELYRAVPYGRASVALQGALKVVSPWEWSSAVQGEVISVKPASGQTLYFKTDSGSSIAKTTGISRSQNYQIQLQNSSGAAVLSGGSPSRYVLADAQGRQLSFAADTGKMLSMKSSNGKLVTAADYSSKVKLNYNSSGAISSAYSAAKGAMNVKYGADGSVAMEWYGAKAVRELRSDGSYAVQGAPYRTVSYKAEKQADGTTVVRMTHQQAGLPVRTVVREMRGNNVSISKGGANGIVRSYTRTMEANGVVRTVETIKRAGRSTPAVSRSVVKLRTSGGWVKMSETSGYGSAQAKTTTFSYASRQYQPSRVAKADGSYKAYGTYGRIAVASFIHANAEQKFHYGYLHGSDLLQTLSMPNGVTLTQEYEEKRNLLTGMDYVRENSLVTQRRYTYDALARPEMRDTRYPNKGISHNDSFAYNHRSELTGALPDNSAYTYAYDNIGNREIAQEAAEGITYAANELNQYTRISTDGANFTPEYDDDGNQTLVQTSTGIWHVTYNAQNRAVRFESADGSTLITCAYDYAGRRFEKQVVSNGTITTHQRFIYRNYLQIAAVNLKENASTPDLWSLIWDPTQAVATRPLAIRKDGTWYTYGWDLTKNICEIYGQEGYIRTVYEYTPYGTVTAEGDVEQSHRGLGGGLDTSQEVPEGRTANGVAVSQPIQWSSEFNDKELGLVYYNFRYYNPQDGRWTRRDPLGIESGLNLYLYGINLPIKNHDNKGTIALSETSQEIHRYQYDIMFAGLRGMGLILFLYRHYLWGDGKTVAFDPQFIEASDQYISNASYMICAAFAEMKYQKIYNKKMYTMNPELVHGGGFTAYVLGDYSMGGAFTLEYNKKKCEYTFIAEIYTYDVFNADAHPTPDYDMRTMIRNGYARPLELIQRATPGGSNFVTRTKNTKVYHAGLEEGIHPL